MPRPARLRARLGTVLAALVVLAACAPARRGVFLTRDFADPATAYGRALREHTRSAELYSGFDTVAKAWATWRSPALREALVATTAARYRLGPGEAERMRAEELRAARLAWEFHVAIYTPSPDTNDLEKPDTLWRAVLELPDGSRGEPVQVVALPKNDKSRVEYPYVSPWTREYTLIFPKTVEPGPDARPVLWLTGPYGTLRFDFGPSDR